MKDNSTIEQSSQLSKRKMILQSREAEAISSRSVSPPPPPMPPKPSPSTIHRVLDNFAQQKPPEDKGKNAEIPKKMPPISQRVKSHATGIVTPKSAVNRSKSMQSNTRKHPAISKTALPPLPSSSIVIIEPPLAKTPTAESKLPPSVEESMLKLLADEDYEDASDELNIYERDLHTDSSDPISSEGETDSSLISQVQKVHLSYTKKEHARYAETPGVRNILQNNKHETLKLSKKLPPPPPPSKKFDSEYDDGFRQQPTTNAAPFVAPPLRVPPETPPSVVNIPLFIEDHRIPTAVQAISVHGPSVPSIPPLPPRPSRSTLARAHTIASGSRKRISRSVSPELDSCDTDYDDIEKPILRAPVARKNSSLFSREDFITTSIYPDLSQATRNPPLNILKKPFLTGHRGALSGLVASRNLLVTASSVLRTWDIRKNILTGTIHLDCTATANGNATQSSPESSSKVCAVVIAPTRNPQEEGRYVWIARQDTTLSILDLWSNSNTKVISKRADVHTVPVTFLLRCGNSEVWSIDEQGTLNIWDTVSEEFSKSPNPLLKAKPQQHKVTPQAVAATIYESRLWMSSGRDLEAHIIPSSDKSDRKTILSARVPNDMGKITKLLTIPYHAYRLFASHGDGKISIWNTKTMERVQVITVSMYSICTMVSVGEFHVWAGYNTGMIYVYDTRPDKWVVLKMWKAHSAAVIQLYVDETGLLLDECRGRLQVVSGDSYGYVGIWDGLLTEHWKDTHLQQKESEFCDYDDVNVMICSWNVDATKPDKITGEDEKCVREWLGTMEDPDIIVVGIQEIIDLVSKKQTARSLFFKKKIDPTEAEEMRKNRYKQWLDYLVQIIATNYGKGTFTVAKTDELVGLFSCVFVREQDTERIFDVDSTTVKTGLKVMNKSFHGNKGGIAIRFVYDHSSLCFVNCHLAAGQSHVQQRNADAEGILHGASFPRRNYADVFYNGGDGAMILDHEYCFLSGDLNYRINMKRGDVLKELSNTDKEKSWEKLQKQDQLLRQKINNPLFKLLTFEEAPIHFDPTYKYDVNSDYYDSSVKQRIPAWCDRVLFKGKRIKNIFYRRFEAQCSDHRPISAGFSFKTKITDQTRRSSVTLKINSEWCEYIDQIVRDMKAKYVSKYNKCTQNEASKLLENDSWDVTLTVKKLMDIDLVSDK